MKLKLGVLALVIIFGSCARKSNNVSEKNQKIHFDNKMITLAKESSDIKMARYQADDGNLYVGLPLSEIDGAKEFLFTVSQIDGAPAPKGHSFASKIVTFKKRNQKLHLYESLAGQLASDDVSTKKLLASFDVVKTLDLSPYGLSNYVFFNFNSGMKLFFMKRSSFISDYPETAEETPIEIFSSVLERVEDRGEYTFIDQMAQLQVGSEGKISFLPTHIKYTFSPYRPNPQFQKIKSLGQEKIVFFESHQQITPGSGEENIYISKFDYNKKIVFNITNNIPTDFIEAVKDGILYWNQALGREAIEVQSLPAEVSVHEPGYNIVQWLNWDTAGFAYADMMLDPRTGETLQAHVYLTSVFATSGLKMARAILEQLSQQRNHNTQLEVGIPGLQRQEICQHNIDRAQYAQIELGGLIKTLDSTALSEEEKEKIYLRFAQDKVRDVVAHEIGHTLGLRHNFAGSIFTNINRKNYDQLVHNYIFNDEIPTDLIPTSTVMDYTAHFFSGWAGSIIRSKQRALPYDELAMAYSVSGNTDLAESDIPFCTDSHVGKYLDCKRFDWMNDPIDSSLFGIDYYQKLFSYKFVSAFEIIAKEEDEKKQKNLIHSLNVKEKADALTLANEIFIPYLTSFSKSARFVINGHAPTGARETLNESIIYLEGLEIYKAKMLNQYGDLSYFLEKVGPRNNKSGNFFYLLEQKINAVMQDKYPELSEKYKYEIQSRLGQYLTRLENESMGLLVQIVKNFPSTIEDDRLAETISQFVSPLIKEKSGDNIYDFRYGVEISGGKSLRSLAVELLVFNPYPHRPSFKRTMAPFVEKISQWHAELIAPYQDESVLDDKTFDFINNEQSLMGPIKSYHF